MASLQEQTKEICELAEKVINNPKLSPKLAAKELCLSAAVVELVFGGVFLPSPIILFGTYLLNVFSNHKKKELEKKRMLKEIIRKQQATIRKLEQENKNNQAEIDNLKEMLRILEEAESEIKAA